MRRTINRLFSCCAVAVLLGVCFAPITSYSIQYGRPVEDVAVDGWSPLPAYQQMNEVIPDDNTYISGSPSNGPICEVKLSSLDDPMVSSGHTIRYRAQRSSRTFSADIRGYVYQGETLISVSPGIDSLLTAYTTYNWTLTIDEGDAITDYDDLRIRLELTNVVGSPPSVSISWMEMEIPEPPNRISGVISTNSTWRADISPYTVTSNATVSTGVVLTIEPGVEVLFESGTSIQVLGAINASGTSASQIVFRAHASAPETGGITIIGNPALSATGVFANCTFTDLGQSPAVLYSCTSVLDVTACTFTNFVVDAIHASRSRISVVGCDINDAGAGVVAFACAGVISSNTISTTVPDRDCIDVEYKWQGAGDPSVFIDWNILGPCTDDGIDIDYADATIRWNSISDIYNNGIVLSGESYGLLLNNFVRNAEYGIKFFGETSGIIQNATVVGCDCGLANNNVAGTMLEINSSILWDNTENIDLPWWLDALTVECCAIQNLLMPGYGNITNDPQFTATYRLQATSPCIDAGMASNAPLTDIDGEARWDHPGHSNIVSIVDIGADEFVDVELDGMADFWEIQTFSNTNMDGTADVDSDGLNGLAEYHNGTHPTNSDTDADLMPDGWEVGHTLDPLVNDALFDLDSDNFMNLSEYIAGTSPTNGTDFFEVENVVPGTNTIVFFWEGVTGRLYTVHTTTNLLQATWTNVADFVDVPGTGSTMSYTNAPSDAKSVFYGPTVKLTE